MKLLITGGRDYNNREKPYKSLDGVHERNGITLLIQGGAKGADSLAKEWSKSRGVHCVEIMALWDTHGKKAGHLRNAAMLSLNPDGCVAFEGGRGTADMVSKCKKANIKVMEVGV